VNQVKIKKKIKEKNPPPLPSPTKTQAGTVNLQEYWSNPKLAGHFPRMPYKDHNTGRNLYKKKSELTLFFP